MPGADLKPEQSDSALVARVGAGDESAMAALYDRHAAVVYSVALRVLANAEAAEDVLQEVFLLLWRSPGAFDASRGALAPWLAMIARNRAIDSIRKRKPQVAIDDVILPSRTNLTDEAERGHVLGKIRGMLERIPRPQRDALEMAFFEGLTHTEIADRTGEPVGTIKTRIRTAVLSLREALAV